MKLLPKSEIDSRKAVEQRTAVEEGLKLAKKVDNLRETRANEEVALEKFRRETLAHIYDEITPLATKRDELKGEVSQLEDRKREALKPLDAEWGRIRQEDNRLDVRREEIAVAEGVLSGKQREAESDSKDARSLLARATSKEELADSLLRDADRDARESESALKAAQKVKEEVVALKEKMETELTHREMVAAGLERSVSIRETDLALREKKLTDGWRLLEDRTAMFERNLKRT